MQRNNIVLNVPQDREKKNEFEVLNLADPGTYRITGSVGDSAVVYIRSTHDRGNIYIIFDHPCMIANNVTFIMKGPAFSRCSIQFNIHLPPTVKMKTRGTKIFFGAVDVTKKFKELTKSRIDDDGTAQPILDLAANLPPLQTVPPAQIQYPQRETSQSPLTNTINNHQRESILPIHSTFNTQTSTPQIPLSQHRQSILPPLPPIFIANNTINHPSTNTLQPLSSSRSSTTRMMHSLRSPNSSPQDLYSPQVKHYANTFKNSKNEKLWEKAKLLPNDIKKEFYQCAIIQDIPAMPVFVEQQIYDFDSLKKWAMGSGKRGLDKFSDPNTGLETHISKISAPIPDFWGMLKVRISKEARKANSSDQKKRKRNGDNENEKDNTNNNVKDNDSENNEASFKLKKT